jgi:hypothetical protein
MNNPTTNTQTAERPAPPLPEFRINNRPWTQQEIDKFEASQAEKRAKRVAKTCTQ